jgi:hypothetical protein
MAIFWGSHAGVGRGLPTITPPAYRLSKQAFKTPSPPASIQLSGGRFHPTIWSHW